ncbi:cbb3-type cytochrome c oxidase subunit I [Pseudogracilibacillus auburnensis]|uniref:cbb3-type cytochrome c oxidase subunit I n=1 Tax=Pseudogracilibacillus auburnensis TaxID=1494959 RepID=UPI001F60CB8A|nr:cbb3-type cytochrome c oxidase subunit I [Pseudogracilibacillus auburnensis]
MRMEKGKSTIIQQLIIAAMMIILMMGFGVLMLLQQGGVVDFGPAAFYQFLTIHGTGMIGGAVLAATAIMWYFLNKYVKLSLSVLKLNIVLYVLGVVMIIVGVFAFEFSGSWTFLYPLPAISSGAWGTAGALTYLIGLQLVGLGLLIVLLDAGRAIIQKYGSLGKGLGWDVITGKNREQDAPPAAVVASTMVVIVDTAALLSGTIVIFMNIIHVMNPAFTFDPLLAKNLTFAFGHILANSTIYMAVIAVYEILSRSTGRPWKSNKAFLIAWTMSTLFTMIVYPHHLLQDTVMPTWALIVGQVLSFANGLPVLVITAYGALMIVYKSGIKWKMGSSLIFLSMFGWTAGVIPAILDSAIMVNHVMHNTKWVPGHFHMYMGLGVIAMLFGFMYYLVQNDQSIRPNQLDRFAFCLYTLSILGVSFSFLTSGAISTPRKFATHFEQWQAPAIFGGVSGIFLMIAIGIFIIYFIRYMVNRNKDFSVEKEIA